jgi:hypothetical protein
MSERPFSPEEFVRLLSLPEDHPERRHAEASGRLDAWRQMLREFEDPPASNATAAELTSADAALDRGMAAVLAARPGARGDSRAPGSGGPGLLARLAATLFQPALRPAFALAAIIVVASTSWWMVTDRSTHAVRGVGNESRILVATRTVADGALELSWTPVAGADGYRVRFFGQSLREIARLDDVPRPTLKLERSSLPTGLPAGEEVLVEVAAVRRGDVIAASSPRAVRLP